MLFILLIFSRVTLRRIRLCTLFEQFIRRSTRTGISGRQPTMSKCSLRVQGHRNSIIHRCYSIQLSKYWKLAIRLSRNHYRFSVSDCKVGSLLRPFHKTYKIHFSSQPYPVDIYGTYITVQFGGKISLSFNFHSLSEGTEWKEKVRYRSCRYAAVSDVSR